MKLKEGHVHSGSSSYLVFDKNYFAPFAFCVSNSPLPLNRFER